jgi:nudix-type nucleoside diphosphatase (YffH/AdpP family)
VPHKRANPSGCFKRRFTIDLTANPAVNRRDQDVKGYQIKNTTILHDGWRKLLNLTIQMPGGETMTREILNSSDAAALLPYDTGRRKVILVRQFRAPVMHKDGNGDSLEAIAGLLDGNEPEECARREATEEAGLTLNTLEPLGLVWSAPGATTERLHLFLAPYTAASRTGEGGGLAEEHEEIEVLEIDMAELGAMLDRNGITDLKTLALAQALRLRHPDLFEKA